MLTLVTIVIFTEDLISVFGNEVNIGDSVTRTACSDLGAAALYSPRYAVVVVLVFIAAINERNPGWFDKVKDTAMTLVIVGLGWWVSRRASYRLHYNVD